MVLHNIIKEGLKVKENGQSFLWDVFYVVKLLKTIFLDIVGDVDGETFVEV